MFQRIFELLGRGVWYPPYNYKQYTNNIKIINCFLFHSFIF